MIHYGLLFLLAATSAVGDATAVNASAGLLHSSRHSTLSASCAKPFVLVGGRCLHFDLSLTGTWQEMREFCQQMESDLVVLSDLQLYFDVIQYLKTTGTKSSFWIGATDLAVEGQWMWIDGTPVIMGSPFWANYGCDNYQRPTGGTTQNCAALEGVLHFYFSDFECGWTPHPICEL